MAAVKDGVLAKEAGSRAGLTIGTRRCGLVLSGEGDRATNIWLAPWKIDE